MNDYSLTSHGENEGQDVFICPMHPEIRTTDPGDCPNCGMHLAPKGQALEPNGHSDHHAHDDIVSAEYDVVPGGYSGQIYTCPMHQQVRQVEPGTCPLCGMGLELETATITNDAPNPELVDFTRRFCGGAAVPYTHLMLPTKRIV